MSHRFFIFVSPFSNTLSEHLHKHIILSPGFLLVTMNQCSTRCDAVIHSTKLYVITHT